MQFLIHTSFDCLVGVTKILLRYFWIFMTSHSKENGGPLKGEVHKYLGGEGQRCGARKKEERKKK